MAESELFDRGLQARRDVLGAEYVNANLADSDEFMMAFQRVVTEWAWGYAWSRPGLDRKTRSMLNLAILTALGRPDELGIYVKGAIATGVSVEEIKEILIHATVYCGTPAGRQAFRAAHEALLAEGVLRRPSSAPGTEVAITSPRPWEDTSSYRGCASLHDQVRRADTRSGHTIPPSRCEIGTHITPRQPGNGQRWP